MRIKKMTATFGQLDGAVLELSDGLNLLEAPNEGGKSTWCAFLRAMLYGIPTKERDRLGYVAEKNRYQPWSGAAMVGVVELEWAGKEITLRRFPKGATPFGGFEAVFTDTGERVPGFTGENAGETLVGVPREVFERSAFVGQSSVSVDGDPELEKRIAALISSGEEDVSFSQTERKLKDWQNRRQHNKSGLLPRLEAELEEADALLARLDKVGRTLAETWGEKAGLESKKHALEAEAAGQRARQDQAQRAEYKKASSYLSQCRAEVFALSSESGPLPAKEVLRSAQGDLAYYHTLTANLKIADADRAAADQAVEDAKKAAADPLYARLNADQAWEQTAKDRGTLEKRRKSWGALLALVAAVGAGAALVWLKMEVWLLIPGGLCFLVFALELMANRREAKAHAALLKKYNASNPEDLTAYAEAYRARCAAVGDAEAKVRAVGDAARQMRTQQGELLEQLLDFVRPFAPKVTDTFGISAALSKALSLDERLFAARAKLEGAERLASSLPIPTAQPVEAESIPLSERTPQETQALLSAVQGELQRAETESARAQGERDSLGDPVAIGARRDNLAEEILRRKGEHAALSLALEVLDAANAELQSRFSPVLNRRASQLFSALTGGKYEALTVTREFDATTRESGSVLPRRALLLSRGTEDQLYLAVRLAVCELALPTEEMAPLVLDDAFCNFDDSRMALAMALVRQLAQRRQILLFTCHTREKKHLDSALQLS